MTYQNLLEEVIKMCAEHGVEETELQVRKGPTSFAATPGATRSESDMPLEDFPAEDAASVLVLLTHVARLALNAREERVAEERKTKVKSFLRKVLDLANELDEDVMSMFQDKDMVKKVKVGPKVISFDKDVTSDIEALAAGVISMAWGSLSL